jgi:hypothetical protein
MQQNPNLQNRRHSVIRPHRAFMRILLVICLIGFEVCPLSSLLVWVFRVQHFVESHGERSASVIFTGAMLRD